MPWRGVVRLGSYGQPLDRALLELKFSGWSPVGEELGLLLAAQLIRLIERAGGSEPTDGDGASVRTSVPFDLVVPVPMPALRRWSRGIDHARVIAEALAAELNLPCRALLRQRGGVDQLAGDRRRRGAVGSRFSLKTGGRRSLRRAPRVLLVDDVLTTGATARACARLLGRGGATVHVAVVAVRDPPERRRGPRKMSPAGVQVG